MSTRISDGLVKEQFNAWRAAFSEHDRNQQLHDDSVAWRRVTGVLMVVILLGLLISISAVVIAVNIP